MRIDRSHCPWFIASCCILGVSVALYAVVAALSVKRGGGTPLGLFFGSVGFGFMLFAAALGIRKRYAIWRIGRAQYWMRGHLWLGTLALPIILLHGGFHFGGWLTTLLMILLIVVTLSGLAGAYFQHTLPKQMMREVPYETIYDKIDRVSQGLVTEAEKHMNRVGEQMAPGRGAGPTVVLTYIGTAPEISPELAEFNKAFETEIHPYLTGEKNQAPLRRREYSLEFFRRLRDLLPERVLPHVIAIEEICEEKRQLDRQRTLHIVLNAWLFCHIPLSGALIVLGVVHAIAALRY